MKIFSANQIKQWDAYTILHEPISSLALMERAATVFTKTFRAKFGIECGQIVVLCGAGNNGGDGLAIARMLHHSAYDVSVYLVSKEAQLSPDCENNLAALPNEIPFERIVDAGDIPQWNCSIVLDALFGIGLNRLAEGLEAELITSVNKLQAYKIAVDIPSGLLADGGHNINNIVLQANETWTFQCTKLAFLLPESAELAGTWTVLPIGLSQEFYTAQSAAFYYTEACDIQLRARGKFSHKGSYGHAMLIAGSKGMIGAAILAARACLRAGVGKLSIQVPACGYQILQSSIPEAMVLTDDQQDYLTTLLPMQAYTAVGIGPGIGSQPETSQLLKEILMNNKLPMVLDADALNIIAHNHWQSLIPAGSIISPHPKEFERLLGKSWNNDLEKLNYLRDFCKKYKLIGILKGAYTAVSLADGSVHFNSSGNAGLAKGGSGDVLTGIITALLAQGYAPSEAAIYAVYLHGAAADKVLLQRSIYSMMATDIIEAL